MREKREKRRERDKKKERRNNSREGESKDERKRKNIGKKALNSQEKRQIILTKFVIEDGIRHINNVIAIFPTNIVHFFESRLLGQEGVAIVPNVSVAKYN